MGGWYTWHRERSVLRKTDLYLVARMGFPRGRQGPPRRSDTLPNRLSSRPFQALPFLSSAHRSHSGAGFVPTGRGQVGGLHGSNPSRLALTQTIAWSGRSRPPRR